MIDDDRDHLVVLGYLVCAGLEVRSSLEAPLAGET